MPAIVNPRPTSRDGEVAGSVCEVLLEQEHAQHHAREQGRGVGGRHDRGERTRLQGGLLHREPGGDGHEQDPGRPRGEQPDDPAAELVREHLRHRGLEPEREARTAAEHRGGEGAAASGADPGERTDRDEGDRRGAPPANRARLVDALAGLTDDEEHDQPAHGEERGADLATIDTGAVEPCPDRHREDEAAHDQALHDHERTGGQGRGLQHPTDDRHESAERPDRLSDDLGQESPVPFARRGRHRAALLEGDPQREGHRGKEPEDDGQHERLTPFTVRSAGRHSGCVREESTDGPWPGRQRRRRDRREQGDGPGDGRGLRGRRRPGRDPRPGQRPRSTRPSTSSAAAAAPTRSASRST